MANNEKAALKRVIKADKRFQRARFLMLLALILTAGYSLYVLNKDVNDLVGRVDRLVGQAISEGRTRDLENAAYNTCILQVPLEQRTPEIIKQCFLVNNLPGGIDPESFNPKLLNLNQTSQSTEAPGQPTVVASSPDVQPSEVSLSPPDDTQNPPIVQPENPQTSEEEPGFIESIMMRAIDYLGNLL